VGLERGPLNLVSTTEELLERKSMGFCLENRKYVGIRHADHVTPSIRKSWSNFADKRRSLGQYRSRTPSTEFSFTHMLELRVGSNNGDDNTADFII
jgi:hypothetical protein